MGKPLSMPWLAGLCVSAAPGFVHRQRHGILAKAFLGHKALGRVDQFLQVLDAVSAFLVVAGKSQSGR